MKDLRIFLQYLFSLDGNDARVMIFRQAFIDEITILLRKKRKQGPVRTKNINDFSYCDSFSL